MSTPQPYTPTAFATPIVAPQVTSLFRESPYISVSGYQNTPTAVTTDDLVPGGSVAANAMSLANTIRRASDWLDTICFHTADGTLAASPSTESKWVKVKPSGNLALICKYKPVLQVNSVALGPSPSNLQTINQNAANQIWIDGKIINLTCWSYPQSATNPPTAPFGYPINRAGGVYCVWVYVNGFPHMSLAANATAGASSITITPSVPTGTGPYGVYGSPNSTQLTIEDGTNTEVITVASVSGNVLTLNAPLQYAHTVPAAPDSILVTAIPRDVEQACISLTSALIKQRGSDALVMPDTPGGMISGKTSMAESGGLEDYMTAMDLLAPYTTVYLP